MSTIRNIVIVIIILIVTSVAFSSVIYLGTGYNEISEITYDGERWIKNQYYCPPLSSSGVETTRYLYVNLRDLGFCVVDKENMVILEQIDTFHAEDITFDINKLKFYIADGIGLSVFFLESPSKVWNRGTIHLRGWINQVELLGDYIILSSLYDGIYLLRECSGHFIMLDYFGRTYDDPLEQPLMTLSIRTHGRTIYVAAEDGIHLMRVSANKLFHELKLTNTMSLDVAVNSSYIAAAEPLQKRVSLFLTSSREKIAELLYPNQPTAVHLIEDENTGEIFLATIVTGAGLIIDSITTGDRWTIAGSYTDFIRKVSVR